MFAVKVQFHIRDQFWIPQPKLHGACILDILEKIKKWARLAVFDVFGDFSENSMVLR